MSRRSKKGAAISGSGGRTWEHVSRYSLGQPLGLLRQVDTKLCIVRSLQGLTDSFIAISPVRPASKRRFAGRLSLGYWSTMNSAPRNMAKQLSTVSVSEWMEDDTVSEIEEFSVLGIGSASISGRGLDIPRVQKSDSPTTCVNHCGSNQPSRPQANDLLVLRKPMSGSIDRSGCCCREGSQCGSSEALQSSWKDTFRPCGRLFLSPHCRNFRLYCDCLSEGQRENTRRHLRTNARCAEIVLLLHKGLKLWQRLEVEFSLDRLAMAIPYCGYEPFRMQRHWTWLAAEKPDKRNTGREVVQDKIFGEEIFNSEFSSRKLSQIRQDAKEMCK